VRHRRGCQRRRGGEGGVDRHHLGVHGQRGVGVVTPAGALEGDEGVAITTRRLGRRLRLFLLLQLLLQLHHGRTAQRRSAGNTPMLECTAVEARAVIIVALPDDFAAADNDTAVAVVQRRLGRLLETKGQVGSYPSSSFCW
jgi:hypothetical protein